MQHGFTDFLRHGGNDQYVIAQHDGRVVGRRSGLSLKSTFPNYSALRTDFSARLDRVIAENTRMLLNALTPPDTVPDVTEADLRDVSDAKTSTIDAWDTRLSSIFTQYEAHPQASQRLRTQRNAMEERLLRGFAGLINQLRQEDLNITHYIWRSQQDGKVRSHHAARHGQTFRWADAPEGGHPGQDYNCRCTAEPVRPGTLSNVVLADFAPSADIPIPEQVGGFWRALARRFPALGVLFGALGEQDRLYELSEPAADRQAEAAARLGLDTTTREGAFAAWAHQSYFENVFRGLAPVLAPPTREVSEIAGQAAALYELSNPGAITGLNEEASAAMAQFVARAIEAYQNGRLRFVPEDWANGWTEVYPELTDDERRLGELPGFTPARIEQWLETDPIEELDLPNNTGTPITRDPTGDIVSTPIEEEMGPNVVTMADPNNQGAVDLEERTFNRIRDEFPNAGIERNLEYVRGNGELDGEVDTLVNGIPIEVTIGNGRKKLKQAREIERLTGKAPIIYGPDVRGTVERNLRREGYELVRDLDSLIEALRRRGIDP